MGVSAETRPRRAFVASKWTRRRRLVSHLQHPLAIPNGFLSLSRGSQLSHGRFAFILRCI